MSAKVKANAIVGEEYAAAVKADNVFPNLDPVAEFHMARNWIWVHRDEGRKLTRRFFDNWLARAAQRTYVTKQHSSHFIP